MDSIENKIQTLNVLVVDDMESIRSMVSACLKEMGVRQVFPMPNGEVAWKNLQTIEIDLIVCDWDMPQVCGLELLKLVRGSARHQHIPFLMLTGTTEKERVVAAVTAGVNDFLSKPFQPKELEYRVIKLLRKVKTQKSSE